MSNENKPRYARIGFIVLAGAVAIAATLVYLGGFSGKDTQVIIESYYDKPVSGLSAGSAVNFRGVKIGEVKYIRLEGLQAGDLTTADAQRVRIFMSFDLHKMGVRGRPPPEEVEQAIGEYVARGLRASVVSSGITGLSRIELNMLDDPPPPAELTWTPRHPLIPPAPSLMEGFADAATKAMNQLNKMDFVSVWSNVQDVAASAARLARNFDALVEGQRATVGSRVRSVDAAAEKIEELARKLEENPSLLLRPADPEPLPETSL